MANIKRKQVAFNIDDPLQNKIYNYASQFSNFSFYMKSLILRDMNGESVNNPITFEDSVQVENDVLKSFI